MNRKHLGKGVGVCTHFETRSKGWKAERLFPLIKKLGAVAVRSEIHWEKVEQRKGSYRIPEVYADWVDRATDAGLGIILILDYGNPIFKNPLDPDAFAKYAAFMAKRLRNSNIVAFEIWNEPTNFFFFKQYGGNWSGRPPSNWSDKFCELLGKAANAIKDSDPDATVITNPGEPQFFHMADKHPDAFINVDGISHHPYTVRFPPETVPFGGGIISAQDGAACADDNHSFISLFEMTREHALKKLGKDISLYATEFGFSTYNHNSRPSWMCGYTEETQAAYLCRAVLLSFAAGVETPCIYDFMNDGVDPYDAESNFGLIRNEAEGYAQKKSFSAIQRLIRRLGTSWTYLDEAPATLSAEINEPSASMQWQRLPEEPFLKLNGPEMHWFKTGKELLCFVWKAGRASCEYNQPMGKIIWEHAPAGLSAVSMEDIVTGEKLKVSNEIPNRNGQHGMRKIASGIPVGTNPVLVRWNEK